MLGCSLELYFIICMKLRGRLYCPISDKNEIPWTKYYATKRMKKTTNIFLISSEAKHGDYLIETYGIHAEMIYIGEAAECLVVATYLILIRCTQLKYRVSIIYYALLCTTCTQMLLCADVF